MCIRDRVWEGSLLDARKKASITRRQALFGDHKDVAAAPFAGGLSFWVGIAMVRPPYAMSVVLGRYPYESSWKIGSTSGSNTIATTVCAIRSATVGTPKTRRPPSRFGICTDLTGGEK